MAGASRGTRRGESLFSRRSTQTGETSDAIRTGQSAKSIFSACWQRASDQFPIKKVRDHEGADLGRYPRRKRTHVGSLLLELPLDCFAFGMWSSGIRHGAVLFLSTCQWNQHRTKTKTSNQSIEARSR